ncbi:MAG: GIY-YIG nuclease family protein [Xanthomonadaceae bacterium]|nr:GIY-YIG nuclease family protein [Xanthomonadaceae bacterium]
MPKHKIKTDLRIEDIVLIAKKFKSLKDFKARHRNLYWHLQYIKKIDYVCIKANLERRTPNKYWDYEKTLVAAKACKSRSEFIQKYKTAYMYIRSLGLLQKLYKEAKLHSVYKMDWTFEECRKEALHFKTRSDFFKNSSTYHFARRRGWLEKITRHMKAQGSYTLRKIYAIEHPDKSVYVGLTYNFDRRYEHHMKNHKILMKKKRTIGNKFIKFDVLYPAGEAAKQEQKLIDLYIQKGWKILNINKAGSLGGNIIKWDFNSCLKEAKKYKTREAFLKANPSAVVTARKRGWMNKICSHMNYINYPWTNKELKTLAQSFSFRSDFRKAANGAYQVAAKRGILNKICSHMKTKKGGPSIKWTLEACKKDALKYKTKSLWRDAGSAYSIAHRKKWLDVCCSHMIELRKKWTKEELITDAKKYMTRRDWKKNSTGYSVAVSRNILKFCCAHMSIPANKKYRLRGK